jgi:hypothetical protein
MRQARSLLQLLFLFSAGLFLHLIAWRFLASPPADAVPCIMHGHAATRRTSTSIVQMHGDDASSKFSWTHELVLSIYRRLGAGGVVLSLWTMGSGKERYSIRVAGWIDRWA